MSHNNHSFPVGFLWGAATASHQVEGTNFNNSWAYWENQPGRIHQGHKAGFACDWWGGRWKEDFQRAASYGQNAHRLSIEWSRIQPTPDSWDDNALDFYRQMLQGLHQLGMTPIVTLHHFSDPIWLMEQGGWENEETPHKFVIYVQKVVNALKEYTSIWCTINEPNVYTFNGYLFKDFPPGKSDPAAGIQVLTNMVRGHAAAYKAIHQLQPNAQVGVAYHYRSFFPARENSFLDRWIAKLTSRIFNKVFANALVTGKVDFLVKKVSVPEAVNTQDFFGLNYYTRDLVRFRLSPANTFSERFYPEGAELSSTGFLANMPDGFTEAIQWANSFNLPIFITENGFEETEDKNRPRYMLEHIHKVWQAIQTGSPIKGYFYWSLLDNFEWERGWTQRFGLWGLNTETQERIHRPSADIYGRICKENALSTALVQTYCPDLVEKLFSIKYGVLKKS